MSRRVYWLLVAASLAGFTGMGTLVGAWWLALRSGRWEVLLRWNTLHEAWPEGVLLHVGTVLSLIALLTLARSRP